MKTRTLLLLSLACGVAIMLAGAVLLFQLTTTDEPSSAIPTGVATEVGDMLVTVNEASEVDGRLVATVTLAGTADPDPSVGFRLIASGRPLAVADSTCVAFDGAEQTCEVSFDVAGADGSSRVLFYDRGDDGARWVLAE